MEPLFRGYWEDPLDTAWTKPASVTRWVKQYVGRNTHQPSIDPYYSIPSFLVHPLWCPSPPGHLKCALLEWCKWADCHSSRRQMVRTSPHTGNEGLSDWCCFKELSQELHWCLSGHAPTLVEGREAHWETGANLVHPPDSVGPSWLWRAGEGSAEGTLPWADAAIPWNVMYLNMIQM